MLGMSVDVPQQAAQAYPATATLATCSSVAPPDAKNAIVVRSIAANLIAGAAAENRRLVLRDGPSGTGTILWSMPIWAPANGAATPIILTDISIIIPTGGNVATLEFDGAGAAGSQEGCAMTYLNCGAMIDGRSLGRVL